MISAENLSAELPNFGSFQREHLRLLLLTHNACIVRFPIVAGLGIRKAYKQWFR